MSPDALSQQPSLLSPAHLLALSPSMAADHQVLNLNSPEFKIGRSKDADLCLMDVNISRLQCVLSWCQDTQQWCLTDHSSNGVWVEGVRTTKGIPTRLNQGDVIVLSELKQQYCWRFGLGTADTEETDLSKEPLAKKRRVLEGGKTDNGENMMSEDHLDGDKIEAAEKIRLEKLHCDNALKVELKKKEEELEEVRANHASQLKRMEKEKEESDMEIKRKKEELEILKNEQTKQEEKMRITVMEMEYKREEMALEVEDVKAGKSVTEEESKAKARRIADLEEEMNVVVRELSGVRGKDEEKTELLARIEETLEKQYQCPTCLELFISPVVLNCGHTYCWLCLAQWKSSSGRTRGDLGTCPQCRVPVLHENRIFAIDQMIDAMMEQLGERKKQERVDTVRNRKVAENQFKSTATASAKNTANRSRAALINGQAVPLITPAAPDIRQSAPDLIQAAIMRQTAIVRQANPCIRQAAPIVGQGAPIIRQSAPIVRQNVPIIRQAASNIRQAARVLPPVRDFRSVSSVGRNVLASIAEQHGFSQSCDQQYMVQFKNTDKTVTLNVYTTKGTVMIQGKRVKNESKKNCSLSEFVGLLIKVNSPPSDRHQFVTSIHEHSDHARNSQSAARAVPESDRMRALRMARENASQGLQ